MTQPSHDTLAAFLGIAWADATHEGCLQAAGTAKRACVQLAHTPEAIAAWVTPRRPRCNRHPGAVCLALDTGPLVSALRTDDFLVLFPLNPLTLARYRDACTPSPATDAPPDAARQLDLLRPHRATLHPLTPQSPTMRALAPRVAHRRRGVGDTVRMTHRLTRTLQNDSPHMLHGFPDQDTLICCDFLRRWPPLQAVPRARRSTRDRCFRDPHVRSPEGIARRLQAIRAARPWPTEAGGIAPNALLVQALVAPLRVTWQAISAFDTAIAPRAQSPPDGALFQALPGAGPVCASRL
jgi:Transposase